MMIDDVRTHPGYHNTPGNAYTVVLGDTYTSQALSSHCRRISLHSDGHDAYFKLNTGTGEHFLKTDEREYITVPEGSTIHAKLLTSNSGTLYISEYEW
jgi:hypothetical protein